MAVHEDGPVQVLAGSADAPLLLTCEHASQRLPAGWAWSAADRWLQDTHWAFDLGAAELCTELAEATLATAVLSSFTRLLVDPNRPEDSQTLFRERADGRTIELNRQLEPQDRARRLDGYWRAYHAAVDRQVQAAPAPTLLAIHSFTSSYEGQQRSFELGVLFDLEQRAGEALAATLRAAGLDVRLNEPYSGKGGFIYSIERHARRHGRRALELEVRQDRAQDPDFRRQLVELLAHHRWAG